MKPDLRALQERTEAKKAAREWLRRVGRHDVDALTTLLDSYAANQVAEARLEEAKWWAVSAFNGREGRERLEQLMAALAAARKET